MKINKWTVGLAAAGLVSLPSLTRSEEKASSVMTALSSTTISGYVDTSAQWNFGKGGSPNSAPPGPQAIPYGSALFGPANYPGYTYGGPGKADGFNLNKVKITIERPLDEAQWAAGYRADLLFGPDANEFATTSTGLSTSDFAIQQAYVALRVPFENGLDFKFGVFNSIIGYESHDSVLDPNYTRSYAVGIEPHTHTGLLVSYQFCDWFGVSGGVANTVGPTINSRAQFGAAGNAGTAQSLVFPIAAGTTVAGSNSEAETFKTPMGAIRMTLPGGWGFLAGSTLDAGIVFGYNNSAPGLRAGLDDMVSYYIGGSFRTPIESLRVGLAYDYLGISAQNVNPPFITPFSAYFDAISGYISIQATEKLSLHTRAEYFWYAAGPATDRTGGFVPLAQVLNIPTQVFALTETVQYDLWKNVLARVEFRWDHQADSGLSVFGPTAGAQSLQFAGGGVTIGSRRNAYMLAANIIYKF